MATVTPGQARLTGGHFGLYRTNVGGDLDVFVRRNCGNPTFWMHDKCPDVIKQRRLFAEASRHYSTLTPPQKWLARNRSAWRWAANPGGKSHLKLLQGRQLVISEDITSLRSSGQFTGQPVSICVILCDEEYKPMDGILHLFYYDGLDWIEVEGREISRANWLFIDTPPNATGYRVRGEVPGYVDADPEHTENMSLKQLKQHHWHVMTPYVGEMVMAFASPYSVRSSMDRGMYKSGNYTWSDITTGSGTLKALTAVDSEVGWNTYATLNRYARMGRHFCTFDLRLLPGGATIVAAKLTVTILTKTITDNFPGGIGVSGSFQTTETTLATSNWNKVYNTLLTGVVMPADFEEGDSIELWFNDAGIEYLMAGGIIKLCVREGLFDIPLIAPTWAYPMNGMVTIGTAEQESTAMRPKLDVEYI